MRFYLQDVHVTSFADGTALTVYAKSIKKVVLKAQSFQHKILAQKHKAQSTKHNLLKANDALKSLEVFMNLFAVCQREKVISFST